jgi:hypothetical protein
MKRGRGKTKVTSTFFTGKTKVTSTFFTILDLAVPAAFQPYESSLAGLADAA